MAAALCGILLAARRIRYRRLLTLGRLRTLRPYESGGLLPEAAQRYCLPLLHPVPPAPPAHGGRALRPRPRGHPQGRPADRHQPHERRRLAVSAPLPHGFAGRSPARCLLGRRPELGIPDLRLGAHVAGRLRLVAGPPAQDVGVFRCLPHRPHPRLLPHLGDPRRCRPRTVGTLQPRHALPAEELRGMGFDLAEGRYTTPPTDGWILERLFGELAGEVRTKYLRNGHLQPACATQRRVQQLFPGDDERSKRLRDGFLALLDDVLFVEDPYRKGHYHPASQPNRPSPSSCSPPNSRRPSTACTTTSSTAATTGSGRSRPYASCRCCSEPPTCSPAARTSA